MVNGMQCMHACATALRGEEDMPLSRRHTQVPHKRYGNAQPPAGNSPEFPHSYGCKAYASIMDGKKCHKKGYVKELMRKKEGLSYNDDCAMPGAGMAIPAGVWGGAPFVLSGFGISIKRPGLLPAFFIVCRNTTNLCNG